ncbi:MAG: branched-chain-amino-acid transaminase [Candidatus Bathyarchaeota archaeon]|nr:MAG: branched-chain-amino-acid transaminase [Candidatus Bathyarchaeota archaeon]
MTEPLVYIDGEYYPESQAKVSVFDHGLLYGDGVFEGIRAYNGYVFKLDEHVKRLYESAKAIELRIPLSMNEFKEAILSTIRKNTLQDSYIRVVVTRGRGDLGLDPRKCPKPTVIIIASYMTPLYEGLNATAVIASTRRNALTALNPMIKSLNYLNNILAKIEANKAGTNEAIMLNQNGTISEGTGDNVFIVSGGAVITPPPAAAILKGITRETAIQLAREEMIEVSEREITVHELISADEAFLTGTAAEIAPLVQVDSKAIGDGTPGPVTMRLIERFKALRKTGTPVYT